ncbi:MAG: SGNH/GDSL hydrolase family protein [Actinomycetales bacterium]|nr:SGNH/GDSL hydrolase family protein [Actinomycetales bacterium]
MTKVVSIGDSIAAGIGDQAVDGRLDAWGGRLARCIEGGTSLNLAVPGARMGMIRSTQVPAAILAEPRIVLISTGGNDIVHRRFAIDAFQAGLQRTIAVMTACQARIVLLTVPDLAHAWPLPARLRRALLARIEAVNEVIRASEATHGALVIDWQAHDQLRDPECLHPDRVHLSAVGYERLAATSRHLLGLPDPEAGRPPSVGPAPNRIRALGVRDVVPLVRKSPDIASLVLIGRGAYPPVRQAGTARST